MNDKKTLLGTFLFLPFLIGAEVQASFDYRQLLEQGFYGQYLQDLQVLNHQAPNLNLGDDGEVFGDDGLWDMFDDELLEVVRAHYNNNTAQQVIQYEEIDPNDELICRESFGDIQQTHFLHQNNQ